MKEEDPRSPNNPVADRTSNFESDFERLWGPLTESEAECFAVLSNRPLSPDLMRFDST